MEILTLEGFNIIGIDVRTTNQDGQGIIDIGGLWQKFINEKIIDKIPNKIDNTIYSIYTEYESDYTKPYTTLIGCRVSHLDEIPNGMRGIKFNKGNYQKFVAKGNMANNIVANKWHEIWNTDINRAYTQDFEVYSEKSHNHNSAEIDIYIAIKN
jgi:predicted transcriptional regulator YdeE